MTGVTAYLSSESHTECCAANSTVDRMFSISRSNGHTHASSCHRLPSLLPVHGGPREIFCWILSFHFSRLHSLLCLTLLPSPLHFSFLNGWNHSKNFVLKLATIFCFQIFLANFVTFCNYSLDFFLCSNFSFIFFAFLFKFISIISRYIIYFINFFTGSGNEGISFVHGTVMETC
jgi:hypothetical protein